MSFSQDIEVVTPEDAETKQDAHWSVNDLRDALRRHNVWTANIPGNTECWHKKLLPYIIEGVFTFEDFVEVISSQARFDFSVALNDLIKPTPPIAGGWYNSELAD